MGHKLVKHLDAAGYNRKLFYLDRGAIDLPPIVNLTDIQPGSEARSLLTGEKWILNTHYKWIYIDENWCGCCGGGSGGAVTPGGGQNGNGDEPITPGEEPTIQGITVSPANVTVGPGARIAFTATVEGDPALSRGVVWTIKGQKSPKTTITPDGILTISETETSKSITVKVASQIDPDKSALAVITIDDKIEDPTGEKYVTGIVIVPTNAEVVLGHSLAFNTQINGVNLDDFTAEYMVSGQENANTTISQDGVLSVAADEISSVLVVTAKAKADPRYFVTATVSVTDEAHSNEPENLNISEVQVLPANTSIGQGYSSQFVAVVKSPNGTPSQEVVWHLAGQTSPDTRVTPNGIVFVGMEEASNLLTLTATSVYAPNVVGESDIEVLAHGTPGVEETTIDAIVITPAVTELAQGEYEVFSATVVGKNNPSQAISWGLIGANVQTTYISEHGTLVIGVGETAKSLKVVARSKEDLNKYNIAYVTVALPDQEPFRGIEDVPESPLSAKYVRERDAAGRAVWTMVPEEIDPNDPGPEPEIVAVKVSPEAVTAPPTSVIEFAALLEGSDELSDAVTWSITGQKSINTRISPDGVFFIADDETSKIIKVKATSIADPNKFGSASVIVDPEAPRVEEMTGLYLIPADGEIVPGKSMLFQTIITGVNLTSQMVRYRVQGNSHEGTVIDPDGTLHVHTNEESSILLVTATSMDNDSFSDTAVISVIPEELVENPAEISSITVLPTYTNVARGMSAKFAVQVIGTNNPSADVVWTLSHNFDPSSHISRDGTLYVGRNEQFNELVIRATAVYEPDKFAEARANVISEGTPGAADVRVDAVIITPPTAELEKSSRLVFRASVIGANGPDQKVKWAVDGNTSINTTINSLGVLTVPNDEKARVLKINATSAADPTKFSTAYVTLLEIETIPDSGIEEVPESPLSTDYVRRRDKHGKAYWTKHQDSGGRPNAKLYIGAYGSKALLDAAGVPENAIEGDFAYVIDDETHSRLPAMYEVYEDAHGNLEYRFVMSFGRPPILGDKLDNLFVLDNGVHSTLIKDIKVLEDFDTNEERYELYQSPSAWKLVTELHEGFWKTIKKHPDWYKMIVGMQNEDGSVSSYTTCFTDNHEFEHHKDQDINNPDPVVNKLKWTNTVGKANTFTASDGSKYRRYEFDPNTMTMKVTYQDSIPPETEPGVSPWATVVGEYTLLANGDVIGPLANVTDPTGYLWVSDHEKFMIGSAGDGTQMFCYLIDSDEYFIFDAPQGKKSVYQLATDIHERYFMMFIDADTFIWGDTLTKKTRIGRWNPQGYSGLSTPSPLTRPSISPDGKYYLHTSTNPSTPAFTTFRFSDGRIAAEGPIKGTSSSSIGMDNGKIFTNTPEGLITIYSFAESSGDIQKLHQETPYPCRYVVQFTSEGTQVLCIKVEAHANAPVWFVYDVNEMRIVAQSKDLDHYAKQTNPQGKGCVYQISTSGGERYLVSLADDTHGVIVRRTVSGWEDVQIPFGGLGNNKHQYNQPILMKGGDILITQDVAGKPQGFDLVTMQPVDLKDILDPGGDPHMVQIDKYHLMWCTATGSQLIRIDDQGNQTIVLKIPEQQVLVYGFNA